MQKFLLKLAFNPSRDPQTKHSHSRSSVWVQSAKNDKVRTSLQILFFLILLSTQGNIQQFLLHNNTTAISNLLALQISAHIMIYYDNATYNEEHFLYSIAK